MKIRPTLKFLLPLGLAAFFGCGREASDLLRQGLLPTYDFPLYLSDGAAGIIYKYQRDGSRTVLASGLNNPQGIATDRFNNLFVVERGNNRLLKMSASSGSYYAYTTGLNTPSVVAVDSFGETYITEDLPHDVIRGSNKSVVANFYALPAALAVGVSDILLVGDFGNNIVYWGSSASASSASVAQIVNLGVDSIGRVYAAEGKSTGAKIWRYNQRNGSGATVIADNLSGPQGIAVDPAGNVYVVEKGNSRVVIAGQDGIFRIFTASGLTDPSYVALTQY